MRVVESLKVILAITGLVGFVAMFAGVALAHRKAKRAIDQGREPSFSWARLIFSIYIFAQGAYLFVSECFYERHRDEGVFVNYLFQSLAILLLAVGITVLSNQVRWLIYSMSRR